MLSRHRRDSGGPPRVGATTTLFFNVSSHFLVRLESATAGFTMTDIIAVSAVNRLYDRSVFEFKAPVGAKRIAAFTLPARDYEAEWRAFEGKPAPEFAASDTSGNRVALLDLKGKLVILDFWASCCGLIPGEIADPA